jgi:peptidoglycan/LPS O-acetylase OafA/YrhL
MSDEPGGVSEAVPRRFTAGDPLRAIAAMSVLVFHAAIATLLWKLGTGAVNGEGSPGQFRPIFGPLAAVFVNMRAGIYIFFALSGYLLARSFLAAYEVGSPFPSISRYFRNRALRIIPAFWVVTAIYVIWGRGDNGGGVSGLAAVFGFAQNYHWTPSASLIGQAWTLDIEVAFYIVLPLAALLAMAVKRRVPGTPRTRLVTILLVLLATYVVSLYFKHLAGNPINLTYNIADYLFAFVPGIALAAIEPYAAPRLRGRSSGRTWSWVLLAACIALLAVFISLPIRDHGLRLVFITLGCGALVAAPLTLQWSTGGCWRVLDNRVMDWLGKRSYGIYLIHLGLMTHVLARFGHSHGVKTTFVLLLVGVTAVTLVAADLLWRYVERPALERRLPWRQVEFKPADGESAGAPAHAAVAVDEAAAAPGLVGPGA